MTWQILAAGKVAIIGCAPPSFLELSLRKKRANKINK
jgi:hypothetical protein